MHDDDGHWYDDAHDGDRDGRHRHGGRLAGFWVAIASLLLISLVAVWFAARHRAAVRAEAQRSVERPVIATTPPADPVQPASESKIRRDLPFAGGGGARLLYDAYLPRDVRRPRPAVLLVHGGGWWSGDRDDLVVDDPLAGSLVQSGYVVIAGDYRLACGTVEAPRNQYGVGFTTLGALCGAYLPDQVADVQALVQHVRAEAAELHVDPRRIALLGASSGGHLSLLAAATAPPRARVAAVANWSGPPTAEFIATQETRPGAAARTIAASFTNAVGCSSTECPRKWSAADPARFITSTSPRFAVLGLAGRRETQTPFAELEEFDSHLRSLGWPSTVLAGGRACHGAACGAEPLDADPATTGIAATIDWLDHVLAP